MNHRSAGERSGRQFQYPLFRIVNCYWPCKALRGHARPVSISALSDRELLCRAPHLDQHLVGSFNIRSFGS